MVFVVSEVVSAQHHNLIEAKPPKDVTRHTHKRRRRTNETNPYPEHNDMLAVPTAYQTLHDVLAGQLSMTYNQRGLVNINFRVKHSALNYVFVVFVDYILRTLARETTIAAPCRPANSQGRGPEVRLGHPAAAVTKHTCRRARSARL
jgi:hypothetical protein